MTPRDKIVKDFAEWTAMSAARSGPNHPKSRGEVYLLLRLPDYDTILSGDSITSNEFNDWHRRNTLRMNSENTNLQIGWAAKLLNVYLKTRVYLAGQGRQRLIEFIHPPIDNGLLTGIKRSYGNDPEIWDKARHIKPISGITDYDLYSSIIDGCRLIARKRGILLIEVEELWTGTEIGNG